MEPSCSSWSCTKSESKLIKEILSWLVFQKRRIREKRKKVKLSTEKSIQNKEGCLEEEVGNYMYV